MANAYEARAAGLPFPVFRGYIGDDLPKVNRNSRPVTCPFPGERLAAVPAIRRDVAVIHALKADRAGNVLIEGIVGVQKEAVLAAKRSLVTVEEIVEDFGERSANAVILPSWSVGAIACVPGGAHPSYAHGYYKRDNAYYKAWDAISRDRDAFLAWMKTNVLEQGPGACAVQLRADGGGAEKKRNTSQRTGGKDDRPGARVSHHRILLRRHRHAAGALQSRPPHPCPRHYADLRIRHDRHQARRAAAL